MEATWALTFHDLRPDAQQVLRACGVLDQSSISLVSAAAVAGDSVERVTAVLAENTAWGRVVDDRFDVAVAARSYLRDLVRAMSEQDVRSLLDRLAVAAVGVDMTSAVREDVIGIVGAANRYGCPQVAVRVARAVWRALSSGGASAVDLEWCRRLADHGEEAAIAVGGREGVLELLDMSARAYSARGDWQDAEAAWLGALSIVDDLGDTAGFVRHLGLLAANYRNWGRPHKAVDMLLEIASVQGRGGDVLALVGTFTSVGVTFLEAGGVEGAEEYLGRADRLLRELPADDAAVRARRAVVLTELGRVHARRGAVNSARTAYYEALGLALDLGDAALAERIRVSQTALPSVQR